MILKPKSSIALSTLYTHLRNYKPNFTEKINTLPNNKIFSSYPNPVHYELRRNYAAHLKTRENVDLHIDNILFTAGCTEGIDLCLRVYGNSVNNEVSYFEPVIPLFHSLAVINDLKIKKYWLQGNYFNIYPSCIQQCSIVYICNPNNPTGSYVPPNKIMETLNSFEGLIVVDETYIEFTNHISFVNLIKDNPNIVVLRSFSKSWGMAGLRAGVVIAHPEIILSLQKQQLPFSVNSVALEQLQKNIINFSNILRDIAHVNELKAEINNTLLENKTVFDVFKSETNFIFVRVKCPHHNYLFNSKENLFITDFSYLVPDSLRISIYFRKKNLEFLENINNFQKDA